MAMQLKDKVALVTGGGEGIGKATALLFAEQGARVAVLGRHRENLDPVVAEIEKAGGTAMSVCADVSDPDEMQAAIREIIGAWNRLDVVFANAGVNGVWAPIEELTPEEWDSTLTINLKGTFLTVKYAVPHLKKNGGSVIVNASINGTRIFSNTGATAYSASKAGQVAFTKMMALELAPSKVRVNVICPGAIESSIDDNTEKRDLDKVQIPVKFPEGNQPLENAPGKARQVAQLVLFLASDVSDHITGTEIWVDGAESLIKG
ncbi:NAD(P)-dependent dehydrogenase (short-subunit alcohol dehydrogenase family) [Longimicrobium terrae]|uniref:NAD(P)-dependent dehydrogenase (Short-subunit alcohol dehydrogenase family) n=2 Tax=Longimicrobium terrae TaxID=1639882 RepID=A0A841H5S9_9BACT|nr:SDR family NAD(P)-dependent oxidoreductase [Longimicrobium terrae]MBB6073605.1 NAD(P)-dependent dehydrogenase (short-subunit alcohol dehydrogenase family) [Longimicrobium terrae]